MPQQHEVTCPECGQNYKGVKQWINAALGRHRRFKHGVMGKYVKKHMEAQKRKELSHANGSAKAAVRGPRGPYKKSHHKQTDKDQAFEREIAFAYGHCLAWLEEHASRCQLPRQVLAERVAALLSKP